MKKGINLIVLLIVTYGMISCDALNNSKPEELSESDFKTITIHNNYQLDVPEYMSEGTDLNDEASLQYQNIIRETYVIVLDESKQEFIDALEEYGMEANDSISVLERYRRIQMVVLGEGIDMIDENEPVRTKINGLDAEIIQFDGTALGIVDPISYYLTFLEGEEKMYLIMAWTFKERKVKYGPTFGKMIKSFKEINGK